ncbi:MAG: hypothetical protein RBS39_02645 [Phycisphaerales bacterium]|jgi:hypothetical protein|nr:hypothetical protein [Phycisphaerales bacterium]
MDVADLIFWSLMGVVVLIAVPIGLVVGYHRARRRHRDYLRDPNRRRPEAGEGGIVWFWLDSGGWDGSGDCGGGDGGGGD